LFSLAVVIVPPVVLTAAEALAAWADDRAGAVLHLVLVGGLVAVIVLQALRRAGDPRAALALVAAALLGCAAAVAYSRVSYVRSFLTVLAPAPLVFLALFLFASPVTQLVLPSEPEAQAASVSSDTPVVILVFDELAGTSLLDEDLEIDQDRYPNFAAFARESTWFRNAATVDAWTVNAVPAILTGVHPEHGRLPIHSEHPNNLFTLLADSHDLRVAESLTRLCPRDLCPRAGEAFGGRMRSLFSDAGVIYLHRTLPRDLRDGLPSVTGTWGAFLDDVAEQNQRRLDLFGSFLSSLRPGARPLLGYVHLTFPHFPWQFLPSGKRYDGNGGKIPGFEGTAWGNDEFLVAQAHQRYLLQLGFADRLVGDLLARLRSIGLYDRALVIVLADHGISFRPGDRRRALSETNLEDIAFVPLFVKTPGQQRGRVIDAAVQTVDVLPTIADVLDVDVPWKMDGTSLRTPRAREEYVLVGDKETFTVDVETLLARRGAAVEEELSLFGSSLYGIGPHRELLGRNIEDFDTAVSAGLSGEVDQAAELGTVDLESDYVPVRLTGRINGGGGPRDLAVTVNGRVEAVARSYLVDGEEWLSVLLPESALRAGVNDVALFAVTPELVLVRLWRT
jgi:Sulfatase